MPERRPVDPVTFEVLSNRLIAINDETAETLQQVSGSPVANQFFDMNTSLLGPDGEVVVVGNYLAFHTVALDMIVRRIRETLGEFPGIAAGDMFICNNPYDGAMHQSDVVLVAPIFIDGQCRAWVGASVHQADMGGPVPGQAAVGATSIYEEEIPMPPVKIVEAGRVRPDLEREYLIRSRMPELAAVDFTAMVAANRRATERLRELAGRHGTATLDAVIAMVVDDTEERFRALLADLPDARVRQRAYMDYEGEMYEIWLEATKRGADLRLSFEASEQAPGVVNCTEAVLIGGVMNALLTHLCGGAIPWCPAGLARAIEISSTPGTFINCEWPAGTSAATTAAMQPIYQIATAAFGRLVDAADIESCRALAQGSGGVGVVELAGADQFGAPFAMPVLDGAVSGGLGATPDHDGFDAGSHAFAPNASITNVEDFEHRYPVLYHGRELVPDSGGAGCHRGGRSVALAIAPHGVGAIDDVIVHGYGRGPLSQGLSGGMPGATYSRRILPAAAAPDGIAGAAELAAAEPVPEFWRGAWRRGDVYWTIGAGAGGGYGDPLDRDPAAVRHDLAEGAIGAAAATDVYGVVVEDGAVDEDGTRRRREELRAARLRRSALLGESAFERGGPWPDAVEGRLAAGLLIAGGHLHCEGCGADLGAIEGNYRELLAAERIHAHRLGPDFGPADSEFELRLFYCPRCGALRSSETAQVEESILEDIRLLEEVR